MKYKFKQITAILLALILSFCMLCPAGCSQNSSSPDDADATTEKAAATGDIVVLFTSDYLGVQSHLPLCKSKKKAVRIFGILLYDLAFVIVLMVLMILLE